MDINHFKSSGPARTLHRFSELPSEIQIMVWAEFYLEPRYFVARRFSPPMPQERIWSEEDYSMSASMHVACSSSLYYQSIDTQINRMSYSVSRRLRRPCRFPTVTFAHGKRTERSAGGVADARVNWDADVVCLARCDPYCKLGPLWWHNIQNLVLGLDDDSRAADSKRWLVEDLSPLDKRAKIERIKKSTKLRLFFWNSPEYLPRHLKHWAYVQVQHQSPRIYPDWWKEWHGDEMPPRVIKTSDWNGSNYWSQARREYQRHGWPQFDGVSEGGMTVQWEVWPQFARLSQDGTITDIVERSPRAYALSEGEMLGVPT